MTSDEAIRSAIQAAIDGHPELRSATITVAVTQGVVTTSGVVPTLNQKWLVEDIVESVQGARATIDEIEVRPPGLDGRPDPEIAADVLGALGIAFGDAADGINVSVADGAVRLEGWVESPSQRDRATELAARIRGVAAVSTDLELRPGPTGESLRHKIGDTFRRYAEIDANNVLVEADHGRVVLTGARCERR